jgi:hypothetical protein
MYYDIKIILMKKVLLIIPAIVICFIASCGHDTSMAVKYNDALVGRQVAINNKIEKLFDSFKSHISGKMDTAYSEALSGLKEGTDSVSQMDAFDGKTDLRDAALGLFNVYQSVLDNEFKEIIELHKLPDEQYTKEKESRCKDLQDQIMHKIDIGLAKLNAVQQDFMKENKLDIESAK